MPEEIIIKKITDKDDPQLTQVTGLLHSMYDYMDEQGLLLDLAENGAIAWTEGVKKGLGRFGIVYTATSGDQTIGFAHGSIRLSPDYLGTLKLGVITHVYVIPEQRSSGVGEKLVKGLEEWFAEKEVHSIELQVLAKNMIGIAFWEKLGYPAELQQHRKSGSEL